MFSNNEKYLAVVIAEAITFYPIVPSLPAQLLLSRKEPHMPLKIFQTADLHIGMKFNNYPEPIKGALQLARIDSLKNMVKIADQYGCNLFVISGDLFNGISGIDKKTILSVVTTLESFQGQCVLVMPGNHDYDNDMVDQWNSFKSKSSDKILFVNHEKPYSLADYDIDAVVYPAPCHSKHSSTNNLGWIKKQDIDKSPVNIGIAHGAIIGISPDMDSNYFNMTQDELNNIPMDVWLLGHTHITYPAKASVTQWKIFNPGTPEPDGLDCKHRGSAWIISIDDNKAVTAETVSIGNYQFVDRNYTVTQREDLDAIRTDLLTDEPMRTVARIHIRGNVEEDVFGYRQQVYKDIDDAIGYLIIDDSDLGIKITKEKINKEFSDGSFPQQLLSALSEDDEALQLAYELIAEVRK